MGITSRTCIEVAIRVITTYGFNGALDAIQVQCLLMGIEPAMGITLCSLPVFVRLVSPQYLHSPAYTAEGSPLLPWSTANLLP